MTAWTSMSLVPGWMASQPSRHVSGSSTASAKASIVVEVVRGSAGREMCELLGAASKSSGVACFSSQSRNNATPGGTRTDSVK